MVHYAHHSRNSSQTAQDFLNTVSQRQRIRDMYRVAMHHIAEQASSGGDVIKEQAKTVMRIRRTFPQTFFAIAFICLLCLNLTITHHLLQQLRHVEQASHSVFDMRHYRHAVEWTFHTDPAPFKVLLQQTLEKASLSFYQVQQAVDRIRQHPLL